MFRQPVRIYPFAVAVACVPGGPAVAHVVAGSGGATVSTWSWEPWTVASLLLSAALYVVGLCRLRARSRSGLPVLRVRAVYFAAGWLVAAGALVSPIDPIGGELFSVHMVQHELLMLVSAPIIVLARPGGAFAWSLPWTPRHAAARLTAGLRAAWRVTSRPLPAWTWHFAVLWGWHVPWLFHASLRSDAVHTVQHLSFMVVALLFWSSVLRRDSGAGIAIFSLFTTAFHSTVLGAMLTFAPAPWYSDYIFTAPRWGLAPLEDQQLGGLIMWVPGGIAYLVAGLALLAIALNPRHRSVGQEADAVRLPP